MEIERKFLVKTLPSDLGNYSYRIIEQGYLNTDPVIRIRRDNEKYELTYKSRGLMAREEYNMPLTEEAYTHLLSKIDGLLIKKCRYMLPLTFEDISLTIELDVFEGELAPLVLAEVEFPSEEMAERFIPPEWFGDDVTFSGKYHNNVLSQENRTMGTD